MSALTGNSISSSYTGLLKTNNNGVLSATEQNMTDGAGNASTLSMGTTSASFTGTLDLASATVVGLPGGAPGMVSGAGPDSIVSAASLTTTAAVSTSINGIAIGEGASVLGDLAYDRNNIAIGTNAQAGSAEQNVALGFNANTTAANRSVAVGVSSKTISSRSVAVGNGADANNFATVTVGDGRADGESAISIGGYNTRAQSTYSIAIGRESQVPGSMTEGMVMGYQRIALWAGALSIPRLALHEVATLNFADQAAAVLGGVPTGGVYHTDGALKIVY